MGEKFSLSEEELELWRLKISECEKRWESTRSITDPVLFLVWLYEYLEAFTVNHQNISSNLKSVKRYFTDLEVMDLFKLRGQLVHRPYIVDDDEIIKFYNSHAKIIKELKSRTGFIQ